MSNTGLVATASGAKRTLILVFVNATEGGLGLIFELLGPGSGEGLW